MNSNMKLLIGAGSAALFGISALNGCSSDSDSGPAMGVAGMETTAGSGGASVGNAGTAGTPSTAGTGGTAAGAGGMDVTSGAGGAAAGSGGATGGAGGSAAGTGGSTGGSGGSGGSTAGTGGAAAGSGGAGVTPSAACTTFCNDEETVCTFTGENAAYASKSACFSGCATFTPGTSNTGNTLACRQYHVTNAKTMPKDVHCPHTALISHNKGSAATATDGPCN